MNTVRLGTGPRLCKHLAEPGIASTYKTVHSNEALALLTDAQKIVHDLIWRGLAIFELHVMVLDACLEECRGVVGALVEADVLSL